MRQLPAHARASVFAHPPRTIAGDRLLLAAMCLAVLLAQIDTSVINLALPSIGASLHAGVTGLQGVLDGYNLAYAVLLLTGGLLADLHGRRRLFLLGTAVFTAGSVLCAAAPDIERLVAGRVIAGAGAALLLPASLAIIRVAWSDERARSHALGIWAAYNGLAFVIGPTVGGALVEAFGWRSVFLIAVPTGLATIALTLGAVRESRDPAGRRFDALGQITGAAALACLALAGVAAAREAELAVAAFAVAILAGLLFVAVERRRGTQAMVPLDLFASRLVAALAATSAMTFGMYGVLFLVPLVWQQGGVLAPGAAGIALVPMAGVFFAVSNASGRLVPLAPGDRRGVGGASPLR